MYQSLVSQIYGSVRAWEESTVIDEVAQAMVMREAITSIFGKIEPIILKGEPLQSIVRGYQKLDRCILDFGMGDLSEDYKSRVALLHIYLKNFVFTYR